MRDRTGGLRNHFYRFRQRCGLNHGESSDRKRRGHERASVGLDILRVSISYLHRCARNPHQHPRCTQSRIMRVRCVANVPRNIEARIDRSVIKGSAPTTRLGLVRSKRLSRLLHPRGRLITDAGEHGEKVPVTHGRTQEGPAQSPVLYVKKLPPLIVRQPAADGPLK